MSAAETETVAWLVEHHLLMSLIAFSRDIGDPKTIRDFANVVQSPERLKLLLVLTVADIRAVGPSAWNGWKGQLLRGLYYETEPVVAGGHTQLASRERVRGPGRLPRRRRRLAGRGDRALRRAPLSRLLAEDRHAQGRRARQARPRRRAGGREARHRLHHRRLHGHHRAVAVRPQPSPPAGAVCRRLRRLAAPTSRAPTSPPRATASRSTPSCWRASSSRTRTSCAARGASPRPSRRCSRARPGSAR